MATESEASCDADPNFAVICGFLEKFGTLCGLNAIDFLDLQEMLENTQEVSKELIDLHIKLLRKARKSVSSERWERALIKLCHTFCSKDGWELERFGYKKARIGSKLRILKQLLEMQFDLNQKFKNDVNRMSAEELRSQPIGRDSSGRVYWYQCDEACQIRVYKDDPDEETWSLVAKDRDGLANLITQLNNGDSAKSSSEPVSNEDSNSVEQVEKPIIDTGQKNKETESTESINVVNEIEESDNAQCDTLRTETKDGDCDEEDEDDQDGDDQDGDDQDGDDQDEDDQDEDSRENMDDEDETSQSSQNNEGLDLSIKSKPLVLEQPKKDFVGIKGKYIREESASISSGKAVRSASKDALSYKRPLEDDEIEEPRSLKHRRLNRPTLLMKKTPEEEPEDYEDEEIEEEEEEDEEDEDDEEVGEEIEEPLMLIQGHGNGYQNKSACPIVGETIEDTFYFYGPGNGHDCETGNETTGKAEEKSEINKINPPIKETFNNSSNNERTDKTPNENSETSPKPSSSFFFGSKSFAFGASLSFGSSVNASSSEKSSLEEPCSSKNIEIDSEKVPENKVLDNNVVNKQEHSIDVTSEIQDVNELKISDRNEGNTTMTCQNEDSTKFSEVVTNLNDLKEKLIDSKLDLESKINEKDNLESDDVLTNDEIDKQNLKSGEISKGDLLESSENKEDLNSPLLETIQNDEIDKNLIDKTKLEEKSTINPSQPEKSTINPSQPEIKIDLEVSQEDQDDLQEQEIKSKTLENNPKEDDLQKQEIKSKTLENNPKDHLQKEIKPKEDELNIDDKCEENNKQEDDEIETLEHDTKILSIEDDTADSTEVKINELELEARNISLDDSNKQEELDENVLDEEIETASSENNEVGKDKTIDDFESEKLKEEEMQKEASFIGEKTKQDDEIIQNKENLENINKGDDLKSKPNDGQNQACLEKTQNESNLNVKNKETDKCIEEKSDEFEQFKEEELTAANSNINELEESKEEKDLAVNIKNDDVIDDKNEEEISLTVAKESSTDLDEEIQQCNIEKENDKIPQQVESLKEFHEDDGEDIQILQESKEIKCLEQSEEIRDFKDDKNDFVIESKTNTELNEEKSIKEAEVQLSNLQEDEDAEINQENEDVEINQEDKDVEINQEDKDVEINQEDKNTEINQEDESLRDPKNDEDEILEETNKEKCSLTIVDEFKEDEKIQEYHLKELDIVNQCDREIIQQEKSDEDETQILEEASKEKCSLTIVDEFKEDEKIEECDLKESDKEVNQEGEIIQQEEDLKESNEDDKQEVQSLEEANKEKCSLTIMDESKDQEYNLEEADKRINQQDEISKDKIQQDEIYKDKIQEDKDLKESIEDGERKIQSLEEINKEKNPLNDLTIVDESKIHHEIQQDNLEEIEKEIIEQDEDLVESSDNDKEDIQNIECLYKIEDVNTQNVLRKEEEIPSVSVEFKKDGNLDESGKIKSDESQPITSIEENIEDEGKMIETEHKNDNISTKKGFETQPTEDEYVIEGSRNKDLLEIIEKDEINPTIPKESIKNEDEKEVKETSQLDENPKELNRENQFEKQDVRDLEINEKDKINPIISQESITNEQKKINETSKQDEELKELIEFEKQDVQDLELSENDEINPIISEESITNEEEKEINEIISKRDENPKESIEIQKQNVQDLEISEKDEINPIISQEPIKNTEEKEINEISQHDENPKESIEIENQDLQDIETPTKIKRLNHQSVSEDKLKEIKEKCSITPSDESNATKKSEEVKPEEIKPQEVKSEEIKPQEVKSEEMKPQEVKPEEIKPQEVKPEEIKPQEIKPEKIKPQEIKSVESQPITTENIEDEVESIDLEDEEGNLSDGGRLLGEDFEECITTKEQIEKVQIKSDSKQLETSPIENEATEKHQLNEDIEHISKNSQNQTLSTQNILNESADKENISTKLETYSKPSSLTPLREENLETNVDNNKLEQLELKKPELDSISIDQSNNPEDDEVTPKIDNFNEKEIELEVDRDKNHEVKSLEIDQNMKKLTNFEKQIDETETNLKSKSSEIDHENINKVTNLDKQLDESNDSEKNIESKQPKIDFEKESFDNPKLCTFDNVESENLKETVKNIQKDEVSGSVKDNIKDLDLHNVSDEKIIDGKDELTNQIDESVTKENINITKYNPNVFKSIDEKPFDEIKDLNLKSSNIESKKNCITSETVLNVEKTDGIKDSEVIQDVTLSLSESTKREKEHISIKNIQPTKEIIENPKLDNLQNKSMLEKSQPISKENKEPKIVKDTVVMNISENISDSSKNTLEQKDLKLEKSSEISKLIDLTDCKKAEIPSTIEKENSKDLNKEINKTPEEVNVTLTENNKLQHKNNEIDKEINTQTSNTQLEKSNENLKSNNEVIDLIEDKEIENNILKDNIENKNLPEETTPNVDDKVKQVGAKKDEGVPRKRLKTDEETSSVINIEDDDVALESENEIVFVNESNQDESENVLTKLNKKVIENDPLETNPICDSDSDHDFADQAYSPPRDVSPERNEEEITVINDEKPSGNINKENLSQEKVITEKMPKEKSDAKTLERIDSDKVETVKSSTKGRGRGRGRGRSRGGGKIGQSNEGENPIIKVDDVVAPVENGEPSGHEVVQVRRSTRRNPGEPVVMLELPKIKRRGKSAIFPSKTPEKSEESAEIKAKRTKLISPTTQNTVENDQKQAKTKTVDTKATEEPSSSDAVKPKANGPFLMCVNIQKLQEPKPRTPSPVSIKSSISSDEGDNYEELPVEVNHVVDDNEDVVHSDDVILIEDDANVESDDCVEVTPSSKPMTLSTFQLDVTDSPPRGVVRKRARQEVEQDNEEVTTNKKRKLKGKRQVDRNLRRSIEEQKKKEMSSSDEEENNKSKEEPVETKKKSNRGGYKRKKTLLGLEIPNIIDFTEHGPGHVRQSRRIAQLKIREEAERRKLEEMAVVEDDKKRKSKKDEDKDYKAEKVKKKSSKVIDEDETIIVQSDDEVELKKKKKKRKKHIDPRKIFDESNPWRSSSDSSSNEEQMEEEEEEMGLESDPGSPLFKSDHEFSPESEIEGGGEVQPLKRARTARKEDDEEIDDCACQKCGKKDHPEWILLCDGCDNGWHCSCLRPALLVIPEGDWYCPPCQHVMLIKNLEKKLADFDKKLAKKEIETRRRERLAYVGISLANVLPVKEIEKRKKVMEQVRNEENSDSSDSESSNSESESGSESDSDEPCYQLRQRRQAHSYRFNDYDELINSAIRDEMDAVKGAGNQGRGKDITTIVNAQEEPEKTEVNQPEETQIAEKEVVPEEQPPEKVDEVQEEQPEEHESEPEEEEPIKPVKKFVGRKKPRKLNSLDVSSGDDAYSDEDFKGSSSDEDEDDYEDELGSDSSDYVGGRKKGPIRRSTRARTSRYDKDFINDDSDDDDDEEGDKKRKKSYRPWTETESEESDQSWGRRKRSKKNNHPSPKKRKPKKSKKRFDDSDEDHVNKKKRKIKYGGLNDDDDTEEVGRRTRGKKINYAAVLASDSDDDVPKKTVQKLESDDDFVAEDAEQDEEDDEAIDEEEMKKLQEAKNNAPNLESRVVIQSNVTLPPTAPVVEKPPTQETQEEDEELNPIEAMNRNLEEMNEEEMEKLMEEEEYATKQLQLMALQLEKEKKRKEREAQKKVQDEEEIPPPKVPQKRGRKPKVQNQPPVPVDAPLPNPTVDDSPKKRRGRGKGKKTLEKEAAAAAAAASTSATATIAPTVVTENISTSSDLQTAKLAVAAPPQPFAQTQPVPSVITRMLQGGRPGDYGQMETYYGEQPVAGEAGPPPGSAAIPPGSLPPIVQPYIQGAPGSAPTPQYRPPPAPQLNPYHRSSPIPAQPQLRLRHPAPAGGIYQHHPLDPSPSGGGAVGIPPTGSTPEEGGSPVTVPPSSESPHSNNKPDQTLPRPPQMAPRFGTPPVPVPPAHIAQQSPRMGMPYQPPVHQPSYFYMSQNLGSEENMNYPYGEQFTDTNSPQEAAKGYEEENSGEFGGLVSYFSSQREDDLDT